MKTYMSALEEMNTEAVEYVRGIPVVKVFQQTVFSFKNFHDSILRYKDMVYRYTLMWEKPMTAYTVIIHGFAYFLIPVGILLITYGAATTPMLIDLFFYILLTPVFAQSIMREHVSQPGAGPGQRGGEPGGRSAEGAPPCPCPWSQSPSPATTSSSGMFRFATKIATKKRWTT